MPPNEENAKALLSVPPKSYGNFDYGFSVGRGSFNLTCGTWITVAERIRLNDPGDNNGNIAFLLFDSLLTLGR